MLSAIISTARKDLWRLGRDRASLLMWIGIPLTIGGLLMLIASGPSASTPKAQLLIVDQDDSFLSNLLLRAADGAPVIDAEVVSLETGLERITAGDGSALLVIAEGFGDALLEEEPTELKLITNPAQRILPGIIEESLSILVDATFYAHRIVGSEIREVVDKAEAAAGRPLDSDVARTAVAINQTIQRLEGYLFPPVLSVSTTIEEEEQAEKAGAETLKIDLRMLFVPGVLLMALLFMAQGLADDLWKEKQAGTLRRSLALPHSMRSILAGKFSANAVLIAGVSLVVLAPGMLYTGLPLRNLPLAVLWATLSGLVFTIMMTTIMVHLPSRRAGNLTTSMIIFPLLMIGGSFFPFEAMPSAMAAIGRWTPNGWALTHLSNALFDRSEASAMVLPTAILGIVFVLFFLTTARRVSKSFAAE